MIRILGTEHLATISSMNDSAITLRDQGKLNDAKSIYQRALAGHEKTLGRNHISTLETVENLAHLYADYSVQDRAEDIFKRAFEGYETISGTHHERTNEIFRVFLNFYVKRHSSSQKASDLEEVEADLDTSQVIRTLKYLDSGAGYPYQSVSRKVCHIILQDRLIDEKGSDILRPMEWDLPAFVQQECLREESIVSLLILTTDGYYD